ncbi:calcium homeostasis modulator protein 6 isoform X2 [Phyllostomus hastatus]|uniref:calcium homeostasis modulator protein 6 isoform X2 n=1 Tax=Phyllostomus hastatus TaxID=9423 RepID=UPI001E67E299|nr:calcium homeostasis modulator protein 6 isoform X2 [Phyllostomus hastatus]
MFPENDHGFSYSCLVLLNCSKGAIEENLFFFFQAVSPCKKRFLLWAAASGQERVENSRPQPKSVRGAGQPRGRSIRAYLLCQRREPMEKLKTIVDLHLKHYGVLGYGLVTALTAGLERIFSTVVFQCPCSATWNLAYGLLFLLVPALALFFLGYLLSARTWRLLTGCCAPGTCTCTCCCGKVLRGVLVFAQLSGTAAVAPLTWVAVALLGGDFYECAASGTQVLVRRLCSGHGDPNCITLLPLVPCGDKQAEDLMDFKKNLKAQSQIAGWILIAAVIICLVIFVSITRCLSPVSFLQLKFWKIYLAQERKIFENQATEHATKLAENNVKCFFECSHQKGEYKTPSKEDWKKVSALYTFNPKELHYSTVHKFVNTEENADGNERSEGETMVALHFVDSFALNTTLNL